jgi:gliding motility-associated-like protein
MRSILHCVFVFILFCCNSFVAQAPPWQWAKEANSSGAEQAWDVSCDNFSGNLYVGGTFNGNLSAAYGASLAATYGSSDGFIAKYDPLGNVLWAFKIGGTNVEEVKSIANDPLGNVYVAGYFRSICDFDPSAASFTLSPSGGVGNQDGFLAKYNASGGLLWATKFGNNSSEDVWRLYVDANGVYLTGSYVGNITFNSASPSVVTKTTTASLGMDEFFGAKYDFNGVVQWVVSGASVSNDEGFDVVADLNNVYFIGDYDRDMDLYNANGTYTAQALVASNNKTSAFIACYYQSSGALKWVTNLGSNTNDVHGGGITQDNLNLYITGSFQGMVNFPVSSPLFSKLSTGNRDTYLAKLSKSNGAYQWVSPQTGTCTGDDAAYEVVCDDAGNINIAGYFTSVVTFTNGTTFTSLGNQDLLISNYDNAGNFLWATRAGANGNDVPYGLTTSSTGAVYASGSHENATVFGTHTLTSAGSSNIFVAKTGCETASNNTIAASQTICAGGAAASLTGSLPLGGAFVYSWQQSADNLNWIPAVGTNTNQNYSPPLLLTSTYYRRNVLSGYSCGGSSKSNTITVVVNPIPDLALAGVSQTLCITSPTTVLSANVPTVGIGTWSLLSGSGIVATPTLASTGISNLGAGNNILRWSISSGVCAANSATVLIKVDNLPGPSLPGNNQTVCTTTVALTAITPTVGAGLWSVSAGTGTFSAPGLLTPIVSGISTGTNTFVWTVFNGVCPAATASVSVVRDQLPLSNAGINQTICAVTSTLAAVTQSFGTGLWTIIAGNSTLSSLSSPSPGVTGISPGLNLFLWTTSNGVCPSATAAVSVYRDQQPIANAGSNQTICASTATLSAITQTFGTGLWSVIAGSSSLSNLNVASPNVSGISTGTNTYLWTVANGVCPSATAAVSIYRDQQPIANAGSNQTICASSATLSAITQTFGTGLWSVIAGSSSLSNLNVVSPSVSGISTGTNTYLWTVANGVCPSATAAVSVYRDQQPIANAGSNQTICASSATLSAITQTFGTGFWSVIAGSSSLSNLNVASPNVSGISTGTNTYLWTVANGVCPSATAAVSIYRDQQPIANAGSNQTICASSATLSAITQTFGTGLWSVIAGSSSLSNLNVASPSVSGISTGTNTYLWTVANGVCPSATAAVSVFRDQQPIANAGSNQTICASTATLSAITQTFGTGLWSVIAGSSSISNLNVASPSVSGVSNGTNTYLWTVSNGVCPSATAVVSVIRDMVGSTANAGANQVICSSTGTLTASLVTIGNGTWTTTGSVLIANPNSPTTSVSGIVTGTNAFLWTVVNGVCPASSATVSVTRDALPSIANAGADQTICTSTAVLTAVAPSPGNGTWSTYTGSAVVNSPNSVSSLVSGITTGNNKFLWTVSNGVCPTSTALVSVFHDVPPIANAGPNQTICASSTSLGAIIQTLGTGTWSLLTGGGSFLSTTSASTTVSSLNTGTNSILWLFANGVCPNARDTVEIYRDATPLSNAGSNQTVCAVTGSLAAITQTFGTGSWSVIAGTSSLSSLVSPTPTVAGISTGTNTYVWTVAYGVCPNATSTVSIIRDALPVANAGSDQTLCAVSSTLAAVTQTFGTGTWSVIAGNSALSGLNLAAPIVSGISTGTNTYLWTVSNGVCPTATSVVSIYRDDFPLANAGSSQTVCAVTATLAAITQSFGTGTWSVITGGGTLSAAGNPTAAVAGITTGANTFLWTFSNGVCPTSTALTVVYRDDFPVANAGQSQTVCSTAATLAAITQSFGTGNWSVLSGPAAITGTGTTINITGLGFGSNTFQWAANNGICPVSVSTVTVFRDTPPLANAGLNQTICAASATLAAITPSFGTGSWSVLSGGGSLSNPNTPTTNLNGITSGLNTFLWTVINGVCQAVSATVSVIRNDLPSAANAGADQTICSTSAIINALPPTTGTGSWSVITGAGIFADPSQATTNVSGVTTGINKLLWYVVSGVCPPATDTLRIQVDALPTIAFANEDREICASSVDMEANAPTIGNPVWKLISGGGVISDSTSNATVVSSLSIGPNVFRWSIKNGVCPVSSDEVIISRDEVPSIAVAGQSNHVDKPVATLSAMVPAVGTGSWSVVEGPGKFDNALNPATSVTGLSVGSNTLRWAVTNGVCPESFSDIVIYVDALKIPTGFSPNGDGINDQYVVPGLDYYENVKFSVFNRWGALVYHNNNYVNDWNGTNLDNEPLADDTYYYIIKINPEMDYSGYVIIKAAK